MLEYRIHPEAQAELREIARYYDSQSRGLGRRFLAAYEEALNRVLIFPESGAPHMGERRFFVRRFPYSAIYRHDSRAALVVAVAHFKRRPGYWQSRA